MTRKTLYADDVKAAIKRLFDTLPMISRTDLFAAIDSLPATEPSAKALQNHIRKIAAYAKQPGVTMPWVIANLEALASGAEPDAGGERVPRPPMLLAKTKGIVGVWIWVTSHDNGIRNVWRRTSGAEYWSGDFREVDRTASDPEAIRMFDADVAASGRNP